MKNISLRKFLREIVTIQEPIEVSRRDPDGDIHILGFWTPYSAAGQAEPPVIPKPSRTVIRTPDEAVAAVPATPRAYPKDVQAGRRRRGR